jgi:hypothetical protein
MNSSHVKRKLHFENNKDEIQEDSTIQLINTEKRKKRYFEHFICSPFETTTKFNMPYTALQKKKMQMKYWKRTRKQFQMMIYR